MVTRRLLTSTSDTVVLWRIAMGGPGSSTPVCRCAIASCAGGAYGQRQQHPDTKEPRIEGLQFRSSEGAGEGRPDAPCPVDERSAAVREGGAVWPGVGWGGWLEVGGGFPPMTRSGGWGV